MTTIRRILAATDFSQRAARAVNRAALLSRELGAALHLLNIVDSGRLAAITRLLSGAPADMLLRLTRAAEDELARECAAVRARHGVETVGRVVQGEAAEAIAAAGPGGAVLTVVGAQGEHFIRDVFVGATAQRLLAECNGPVLLVKKDAAQPYRRVVVATDLSTPAAHALRLASELAPAAEFFLLHVYEVPFEGKMRFAGVTEEVIEHYRQTAERQARADADAWAHGLGAAATVMVRHGFAAAVVMDAVRELDADLVAVGAHNRSTLSRTILGSVSLHLVQEADTDVLVVHKGTHATS